MNKKILKFLVVSLENMFFFIDLILNYNFSCSFSENLEFKKNQRFNNIRALYLNNLDFYIKDKK